MNLPLRSVRRPLDHTNRETQRAHRVTQIYKCTNTATWNRHTVSVCNELWPTVPLGYFLLFFTLWSSSEHEFIWSNDQKIKRANPSVCLGHSVSVSTIYGKEKLKETAGHFDQKSPNKKHCLILSLLVAQEFDVSLSTNTVAFYDWPYPRPKPFPAHFSQAVCQPVLERLLSLCSKCDLK